MQSHDAAVAGDRGENVTELFYDRVVRQLREYLAGSDHITADTRWLAEALTGDLGRDAQVLAAEILVELDERRKRLHSSRES